MIRRIILHWTAGGHEASEHDRASYHWLLEHAIGDPADPTDDKVRRVLGVPAERNATPTTGRPSYERDPERGYAPHTYNFNTGSLGVALCGMRGAVDGRPGGVVQPGTSPITLLQVRGLLGLVVELLGVYGLDPTPEQLFTHYEAEALHGVDQLPRGPGNWKWDITWLPHRPDVAKDDVGPWLREQVARWQRGAAVDA